MKCYSLMKKSKILIIPTIVVSVTDTAESDRKEQKIPLGMGSDFEGLALLPY